MSTPQAARPVLANRPRRLTTSAALRLAARPALWAMALSLALTACSKPEPEVEQAAPGLAAQPPAPPPADAQGAARHELFSAELEWAMSAVEALALKARALLDAPTAAALDDAQTAWAAARDHLEYLNTALALAGSQTVNLAELHQWRAKLVAWPIEPGAIDHFQAYAFSGLVFDIQVPLTLESVRAMHQQMADSEAVLGLYPVHYLLFGDGQHDLLADLTLVDTLSQTHIEAGYTALEEAPNNRRRRLLALQVASLRQDMEGLREYWRSPAVAGAVASLNAETWRAALVAEIADTIAELARLKRAGDYGTDGEVAEVDDFASEVFAQLRQRTAARARAVGDLLPYLEPGEPSRVATALAPLLTPTAQAPGQSPARTEGTELAPAPIQDYYRQLIALAAALKEPATVE